MDKYLTAKELRKELNISLGNWYYHIQKITFPEAEGSTYVDKNHPNVKTWRLDLFTDWWNKRPKVGRPMIDITNL